MRARISWHRGRAGTIGLVSEVDPQAQRKKKGHYDYLICLECESPCYIFEFKSGDLMEAFCDKCTNEDVDMFLPEEDFDMLASTPPG